MKVIINGADYKEGVEYVRFGADNSVRLFSESLTAVESVYYTHLALQAQAGHQLQIGALDMVYEIKAE